MTYVVSQIPLEHLATYELSLELNFELSLLDQDRDCQKLKGYNRTVN